MLRTLSRHKKFLVRVNLFLYVVKKDCWESNLFKKFYLSKTMKYLIKYYFQLKNSLKNILYTKI